MVLDDDCIMFMFVFCLSVAGRLFDDELMMFVCVLMLLDHGRYSLPSGDDI
jgi:hypothetical protein